MSVAELEAELGRLQIRDDPDRWAVTAYRVAMARSELATGPDELRACLVLLDKAGRILTAARAPLEHGRILTAAGNCHRQLGERKQAATTFDEAVVHLDGRASATEQAATLVNQGLARTELGDAAGAIEPLTRAIELMSIGGESPTGDRAERRRIVGAALLNRAQAHHTMATEKSLGDAIVDYQAAIETFDSDGPQLGMTLHGLGSALLELNRRQRREELVDQAIAAFQDSLLVLTANSFPFQNAIAQHSLAVAYEARAQPNDLARAVGRLEAALSTFDPRLHKAQWQVAATSLARVEQALAEGQPHQSRLGHFVGLLISVDESERNALVRERMLRLSQQPPVKSESDLATVAELLTQLEPHDYSLVLRSLIPTLMELPDAMLEAACAALCRAHQMSRSQSTYDAALDDVVHDLLFGPQRVRVRDILEANGWIRP